MQSTNDFEILKDQVNDQRAIDPSFQSMSFIDLDKLEAAIQDLQELREEHGKSYAEIQPALAECLTRFAGIYGETTPLGNTLWAYTMVACNDVENLRAVVKEMQEFIPSPSPSCSCDRCMATRKFDAAIAAWGEDATETT